MDYQTGAGVAFAMFLLLSLWPKYCQNRLEKRRATRQAASTTNAHAAGDRERLIVDWLRIGYLLGLASSTAACILFVVLAICGFLSTGVTR